jgi:hypothetical protein
MKVSILRTKAKLNSISIYFKAKQDLNFKSNTFVIKENNNTLMIRESTILDNKVYKLSKSNQLNYFSVNAHNFIGEHDLFFENEYYIIDPYLKKQD